MRLDRLHVQNFRCYEDALFEFQPDFNLVVGINGSGKTSLLQAVAATLVPFISGDTVRQPNQPLYSEDSLRFIVKKFDGRVRFERQHAMVLQAKGQAFDAVDWGLHKPSSGPFMPTMNALEEFDRVAAAVHTQVNIDLPVVAFYRANRRWITPGSTAEAAAVEQHSRFNGYTNWIDAAIDLKAFELWMIGKTLERLQTAVSSRAFSESFNDELEWVNKAVRYALPDSVGITYDLTLRMLIVDLGNGLSFPFNELSDGQRGMVALFADIARRMCLLNPHMGEHVLTDTTGIILIDELDIHLHPAWQREVVGMLKSAFPKVQFIAASHSPQIIGSLVPENVILLAAGQASHPRVTYGLDSSRVLEEVMEVSERAPEIERLLTQLFGTLENGDIQLATEQLEALRTKAPDLPEFNRAAALLKRKGILGK